MWVYHQYKKPGLRPIERMQKACAKSSVARALQPVGGACFRNDASRKSVRPTGRMSVWREDTMNVGRGTRGNHTDRF